MESMIKKLSLFSFALTLLSSPYLMAQAPKKAVAPKAAAKTVKKMKWVVAHNPTNTALNKMITDTGKEIEKKTNGSITMEYLFYDNTVKARHGAALTAVFDNKAQIAQVELAVFDRHAPVLDIFNMPYLFESHDQVRKVITGSFGAKMKKVIYDGYMAKIQPIAYTYSGGYRMFYGSKPIRSLADFKGLRTTNQGAKPIVEYHKMLGLQVEDGFTTRAETVEKHKNNKIDVEDSELNRLYVLSQDYPKLLKHVKYVTETRHLFYLTMIVANSNFIQGLSLEEKKIVNDELQKLAETERVYSIKQEDEARAYLKSKGVEFIELAPAKREELVKESKKLWTKYEAGLGPLIKEVQAIK